jgi:multiple sugar transport system ATP-binding protein
MAELVLKDICKRYGSLDIVRDVNVTIQDREFLVLVGPSGCGKSTTLRMVAGLEPISSGTIKIGTKVVNGLPPKDRDIAMVFQNYALYQHMTVYDNLAFGLRNRKVPEEKIKREVMLATEILGLGPLLSRKPHQLSGGQQQRVALGRCIVRHPQVFLFDEPLSNLDAKLRAQMRIELKRLRERVATTSIYVTHDQVEAMTLGDRVVVMKDGKIQQVGTPLDIYNRPANKFVASFVGAPAMNFLPVDIVVENGCALAVSKDFSIKIPVHQSALLAKHNSRSAVLGIRPEHIHLCADPERHDTAFSAEVEVTEQLGAEMIIGARSADTLIMASRVAPETAVKLRERISLRADPKALHFFDAETEAAIQ